ncbi:hypothetical protein SLEP1_g25569 [Rubroshorea leprosula]|uniref:Transcription factor CBF/NF-Y/archaeal histone domain-containing protein n=1 Tax=Rubroshorea leprosula TaxID=152421 RepID=A0AAV5JT57_9ROSI|nr:hypothetical protein SLEP1_g25569 [Rubroshorea leprosula]
MAGAEEEIVELIKPEFPIERIKRIMKLDNYINKATSEALFLLSCSTELFLRFLAERSAEIALEKKRKTVKLDHINKNRRQKTPTNRRFTSGFASRAGRVNSVRRSTAFSSH